MGKDEWASLEYVSGFCNSVRTEAVEGALPVGQNSPQVLKHGLYAEQVSGTAFTAPRSTNQRSWLYRLTPSVSQSGYTPRPSSGRLGTTSASFAVSDPNPRRWRPMPLPSDQKAVANGDGSKRRRQSEVDFVDGLCTMAGAGSAECKDGLAIHIYAFDAPMADRAFCNADGDLLLVPQLGTLNITTELGRMQVSPGEIAVIQRNFRFSIDPAADSTAGCRGYVLEVFCGHFRLPDLGPIGANGLAEPQDFMTPTAWFEDRACRFTITTKLCGELFDSTREHSPFDVVGWHGNYAPYKYDLSRFHAINTVTVDHPDPSIFTVLTAPSAEPGVAVVDFVIFPPRWMCAEHTFRPPYYHRNMMSEFMGLVGGTYDAKGGGEDGFVPGGASLHGCSTPHGPDAAAYAGAVAADTSRPAKFDGGLAFMFETNAVLKLTRFAAEGETVQPNYVKCWEGLPRGKVGS